MKNLRTIIVNTCFGTGPQIKVCPIAARSFPVENHLLTSLQWEK